MAHSPEVNANAHLWPIVQGATEARLTTAELWSELRDYSSQPGKEYGPGVWQAINEMRSLALAQRNSRDRFQRAALDQVFTPDLAAPEFNMRDPLVRDIFPQYLARFRLDFLDHNDDEAFQTVSVLNVWRPGMTVGDVYADVEVAANSLANEYGAALIGFSDVRPVTV